VAVASEACIIQSPPVLPPVDDVHRFILGCAIVNIIQSPPVLPPVDDVHRFLLGYLGGPGIRQPPLEQRHNRKDQGHLSRA
jgi:hypothetical protein